MNKDIIYSPFLKKYLDQNQLKRASLVSVRNPYLDIVRSKALMAAFKKWGVKTVADILKIRPKKILNIRGVGEGKLDMLTANVKGAIGGANSIEEKPFLEVPNSELLLGRKLSEEEKKLLGEILVDNVIEDARTRRVFQRLGKNTVYLAACVTHEEFLSVHDAGRGSLEKAIESIEGIIKELACKEHPIKIDEEGIKHVIDKHILSRLSDQQIMILKDRYGLWDGIIETLEDISHKFNITRERVRQIQEKAEDKLRRMMTPRLFVNRIFDRFRKLAHEELCAIYSGLASFDDLENVIFKIDKEAIIVDVAYKMLKDIYYPNKDPLVEGLVQCGNNVVASDNKIKELFDKICSPLELALVSKGKPQSPEDLAPIIAMSIGININSAFIKRCGELCLKTGLDAAGKIGLKRWPYFNSSSLEQLMRMALIELGAPSHYSYITGKMNVMFPHRAPFSERSVHSRLSMHPDIFVWAGRRGTYALVDWGIKKYPSITEFLVQELQQAGCSIPEDELVSSGVRKYSYREASLRMTLAFQKRIFKKLPDGSYTLNR